MTGLRTPGGGVPGLLGGPGTEPGSDPGRRRVHGLKGRLARAWRRAMGWAAAAAPVTAVLVLAVVAVAPALAVRGLVATRAAGDSPFLLVRVHEYAAALGAGQFPVRWMPDAAYGLGLPFWVFYAPLAYAVAAVMVLAGAGVVGAIKVTALGAFVVAALGAYRLGVRQWGARPAGVLAAAAYTFVPYHMVNLYVRGDALSENVAYAILPWVLVSLDRARVRRSPGAVAALAVAVAALLLSHNVSALLAAPVVAAYAAWRLPPWRRPRSGKAMSGRPGDTPDDGGGAPRDPAAHGGGALGVATVHEDWSSLPLWVWPTLAVRRGLLAAEVRLWSRRPRTWRRGAVAAVVGVALGLALAAWFWAPALLESGDVQLESNVGGYFSYDARDAGGRLLHFRGLDLVPASLAVDYGVVRGCDPCRDGLVQLLAALAGLLTAAVAIRRGRRRIWRPLLFWAALAAATTFMITPFSGAVWGRVPLLDFAQFPWRWLSVQGLALAMLAGGMGVLRLDPPPSALAEGSNDADPGRRLPARYVGLLSGSWPATVLVVLAAVALAAAAMARLPVRGLAVDRVAPPDLAVFELLTTNVGSTVRGEYLPRDVEPRPWAGPATAHGGPGRPRTAAGALESAVQWRQTPTEQVWMVQVPGSITATVAFPVLWFPGWRGELQRADVPDAPKEWRGTGPVAGSGWVAVEVPPGRWSVRLALGRSDVRAVAEAISLAALLLLLVLLVADRRLRPWPAALAAAALLAGSVALARVLPQAPALGPVTMDVARTPYPHRNPRGIAFGDARLKLGLLSDYDVAAGEQVTLRLEWDDAWAGSMVRAAVVSPAEPVYHVPDVIAEASATQGQNNHIVLEVPDDATSGLYFVRLEVRNNDQPIEARTPDGLGLGTVYLGPLRITGGGTFREEPAAPIARMSDVTLLALEQRQLPEEPQLLEVRLLWQANRAMLQNYKTSVRLLDAEGETVVQEDKQPVYGFYPTTSWRPGEQIADRRWLPLPERLETRDDYIIEVVLYDGATGRVLGRGRVPGVRVAAPGSKTVAAPGSTSVASPGSGTAAAPGSTSVASPGSGTAADPGPRAVANPGSRIAAAALPAAKASRSREMPR